MNFGDIKDRAITAWKETEDYFKKITPKNGNLLMLLFISRNSDQD